MTSVSMEFIVPLYWRGFVLGRDLVYLAQDRKPKCASLKYYFLLNGVQNQSKSFRAMDGNDCSISGSFRSSMHCQRLIYAVRDRFLLKPGILVNTAHQNKKKKLGLFHLGRSIIRWIMRLFLRGFWTDRMCGSSVRVFITVLCLQVHFSKHLFS